MKHQSYRCNICHNMIATFLDSGRDFFSIDGVALKPNNDTARLVFDHTDVEIADVHICSICWERLGNTLERAYSVHRPVVA